MRRVLSLLLGAALLAAPAPPARAEMDVTAWQYARRISAGPPGWAVLELDGPAWAGARPDLGDLRIVAAGKREIPWRELGAPAPVPERFPVRISDVLTDAAAGRTTFVADLGRAGTVTNRLSLRTTSRDFFKRLTFETSNDVGTWLPLGGETYVYDLTARGGGARLDAPYPETSYRYLRVTVQDLGTPPLAGLGAELQRHRAPAPSDRPVAAQAVGQGQAGNDAWSVLDVGYSGVPVTQATVSVPAARFQRAVLLEGSRDRAVWQPVASGAIYRLGAGQEQLTLRFPRATYRFYRLTVRSGNDPPVVPESVTLQGPPARLLFRRPDGGQLFLLYGNPGARPPAYDLAQFPDPEPARPAPVTLGRPLTVMTEPEVAAPPAPPPATDANPKLWRYERPVQPGTAGFVQVALDRHVLDGARRDLADLRLADAAGLEVPFLLRTDRSVPPASWPYTVANKADDPGESWWVLDLGARLPVQSVRFAAAGSNLTRSVRAEGSDDGQSWRPLGSGPVRRVDTIFGAEENLVLAFPEARQRYLRVVVSGDRRDLEPAEVRGFLPALLFRVEPGGAYRLWYGQPAAGARPYPAVLFADAYAPARVGAEALGTPVDHQPPPERPAFLKPGTAPPVANPPSPLLTYALWGVLGALVAGLAAAVVWLFRRLAAGK